ncbi:MAG: hypothetical protein ACOX6T_04150 [Myxococcales bacterium]|jgi:hypothetical protein
MVEQRLIGVLLAAAFILPCTGCDGEETTPARVSIKNDFANPEMARNPPWTICKAAFQGVEFGKIPVGATSEEKEVEPGLDYVLMVAAWDDPDCDPAHALPIASKNEEEVVAGQTRTLAINMPNHQGPCPPEGVAPVPEEVYERIRDRWPEYGFKPYAERTLNPQCAK